MNRRRAIRFIFASTALAALIAGPADAARRRKGAGKPPKPLPKPPLARPKIIMLDPGHGGRDPGAIGPRGTQEKDITLSVCQTIRDELGTNPALKIVLTRNDDRFLALRERVAMAHHTSADLFFSLHADAAPNTQARGLSAYSLSDKASDVVAGYLARRENAVDAIHGVNLGVTDKNTAAILIDLSRRHSLNASLDVRRRLIAGLSDKMRLLDNPMRAADFAVLKSPSVPSILVETGFLSNADDELLLRNPRSRRHLARLIARAMADISLDLKLA
jgi:N-acetylmuramoyl-L-alanine amidase